MGGFFNNPSLGVSIFFNLNVTSIVSVSVEAVSDLYNIDKYSDRLVLT
jgi:hypothetical protein